MINMWVAILNTAFVRQDVWLFKKEKEKMLKLWQFSFRGESINDFYQNLAPFPKRRTLCDSLVRLWGFFPTCCSTGSSYYQRLLLQFLVDIITKIIHKFIMKRILHFVLTGFVYTKLILDWHKSCVNCFPKYSSAQKQQRVLKIFLA